MKGKNLSKVLAFLLAAVMIFSALPLMAFASDETEPYVVSYGSPAIPMDEMTIVNLADISVEMEKGTVVSGADITWAADAQTGIEFDAAAKTVFAKVAGKYKLTATANGITKNVWVLVKKADETDFYLVNLPLVDKTNFVADDWAVYGQDDKTGVPLTSAIGTANGYIQSPQDRSFIIYKNEIFKDFADYTVEASVDGITADQETANSNRGAGIVGRIGLNDAGVWDYSGIALYIMQNKQLAVRKNETTRSFAYLGTGVDIFKRDEEGNKLYGGNNGTTELTVPELKVWYGTNYRTLKNVFDGNKVEIYLDGEMLYDTTTLSKYPCTAQTNPGYVGVMGHDGRIRIKSLFVKLNDSNLAPATKVNYYNVSFGAPAIPMNENTKVNLADLTFEIGGEKVKGAAVELTLDKATDDVVVENASITAYAKGVYPATVKYGEATTKVYIVVKTAAETEWVLYDKTFEKEVLPEDWTVQTYLNKVYSDKITTVYPDVPNPNPGFTPVRVHETNDNYLWATSGFFTLNNDVVSSFADYTIDVNATFFGHIYGTGYIYGRTNTTNGLLTLDSELQGFEIDNRNDYGIPYYTVFHNGGKNRTKIYEGTDWTVSKTVANQQYQMTQDNFVVKFAGDTLSVYEADDKTEAHTFTATGITQKPGTVGIAAFILGQGGDAKSAGGWTKIEDIKITLNNTADDMPISEAVEPKPEEPKPTINITGSGDATVEAVVGSENTYTVELAPAEGYKVKTLSLIVNGDMRANLNHDSTGLVYTFTSEDLNATTISVEYIPDDGTFNTVMAGASVWEERSAIRFGARTDLIKRSTTNTAVGTLDNRIKVGDTVYEITEIGMLLIPKGLFEGELTVDTKNVARQQVTKVVTLTDTFSDIAINLVGIPTSYYDVEICSRMYVAYEVDGETRYVYTDVIVRTYNQVLEAIGK